MPTSVFQQTPQSLRPFALLDLLSSIDTGDIVLPDFQREYLWTSSHVRSLLTTVLRGWPAGSLLLLERHPDLPAVKAFDGGPPAADDYSLVVLDGQQRLTALYHALHDKGP